MVIRIDRPVAVCFPVTLVTMRVTNLPDLYMVGLSSKLRPYRRTRPLDDTVAAKTCCLTPTRISVTMT